MTPRRRLESLAATDAFGLALARLLIPGDIVLLDGPLGAGKTTLTQAIARGLGVSERVTSPTFTVVRQHVCSNDQGIATLHHVDLYRTDSPREILDLDLDELVEESAVAIVEWGERGASLFPRAWRIRLESDGEQSRIVTLDAVDETRRAAATEVLS
jgi:tRNA threonylcarbamoyladenosine biosynthesis protein TsaE